MPAMHKPKMIAGSDMETAIEYWVFAFDYMKDEEFQTFDEAQKCYDNWISMGYPDVVLEERKNSHKVFNMKKLYIVREVNTMSKDILDGLAFNSHKEAKKYLTDYVKENYNDRMQYYGTTVRYHIAEDWEISSLKIA